METTRTIARWVRLSGSDEEMQALEYVRGLLDAYGLQTEVILHDAYISLPGPASISLADGTSLRCITHSFASPTGAEGLTGEVVACGPGELEQARGKIVLRTGLAMPESVREAEAAGAIAQIYINGPLTHEMIVSPVWGSPDRQRRSLLPHTPVVSVDDEVGARLRDAVARGESRVRIDAQVDTGWRKTPILLASLPGTESQDFVLFSGHLDSWHYGAMDNGSANAAMIEVARLMSLNRDRLRRGLRLAFWSGHSHGRYSGSAWYADTYWLDLHEHCVAHVNVDSLGGQGASVISEGIAMASTRQLGAEVIGQITGEEFRGSRVGRSGDQSFVGLGVPSLWMSLSEQPASHDATSEAFSQLVGGSRGGGLGWWWHTTEDTADKIDPDLLLRDTRIYVAAIARLLSARLLPLSATAEAREVLGFLQKRQGEVGGRLDLSPALDRAEALLHEAERLDAWTREYGDQADGEQAQQFNTTLVTLLRALIPLNYTAAGPFDHDPALSMPPLPLLAGTRELGALPPDSDEAKFLKVSLVRGLNRVVYTLDEALKAVREAPIS
jgi:hypothetical protein